jgi:GNAT superfamily N-acetyltransferase
MDHRPDHDVKTLLVRDGAGTPVGLTHYHPYFRPLAAAVAGRLDDLFLTPTARGAGGVEALPDALATVARQRGWNKIRWITGDDNHRARSTYDQVAEPTMWVTYDMQAGPPQTDPPKPNRCGRAVSAGVVAQSAPQQPT